jgi:hypothetical protein
MKRLQTAIVVATLVATVLTSCSAPAATPTDTPVASADSLSSLSAADRQAIDEQLASAAEQAGLSDPPDVAIIHLISQSEWPQTMVDCQQAAGFDAQLTPDGQGVMVENTAEQASAHALAEYTCAASYPIKPSQRAELTAGQKEVVYAYLTSTLVECLADYGHAVTGIPSKATFLGQFESSPPWNPYEQIYSVGLSLAELDTLESNCAPNTPPDLIYGE